MVLIASSLAANVAIDPVSLLELKLQLEEFPEITAGEIHEGQLIKTKYSPTSPMRVMTIILRDASSTFFTYERDDEIHEATFDNRWRFMLLEPHPPITDPFAIAALQQIALAEQTREQVARYREERMAFEYGGGRLTHEYSYPYDDDAE